MLAPYALYLVLYTIRVEKPQWLGPVRGHVTAVAVGTNLLCVPVLLFRCQFVLNFWPVPAYWRPLGALSVLFGSGWADVALALAELDLTLGQPSWAAPQSLRICSPLRARSRFWLAPFGLSARALFCTRTRACARLLQTQLGLQLGKEEEDFKFILLWR